MKKNTLLLIIAFCFTQLINAQQYQATPDTYNPNGGGTWGAILKIRCVVHSDGTGLFLIKRIDGQAFSSSGTMHLKVGGYGSTNYTRESKTVSAGEYVIQFDDDFNNYTNYPKEYFGRFESDQGGYAWTGPITIDYLLPTVTSVVPDNAILGETVTFHIYGSDLSNDMVYYIGDFGSGTVSSSSSTTHKTFTATSADNNGLKSGVIKDYSGGNELFNFTVDVIFPSPVNLTATAQSSSQINLSWNSVSNTYQYKLYRATSINGSYTQIYTGTNVYYDNTGLNPNTSYYYKIRACQDDNFNSCSDLSDPVSASTGSGANSAPNNPYFYTYSNDITINEPVNLSIRSGDDPDGDNTKINVSSPNSNIPDSNPYISSWQNGQYTHSVPITFSQTGSQTVFAVTYDTHGAASTVISHIYNVLPENTSNNPIEPSFILFPDFVELNQSTDFTVQSGTDPDNDLTKVKIWAANSNISQPYFTNYQAGGHQFTIPISFNQEGTQTIYAQTIDINGNTSGSISRTISVIDGTTPLTEVLISNITFTAANITETNSNIYTLTGNVLANDVLHFTGTVTVDLNDLSVSGDGMVYLTNIPNFSSDVALYNGTFTYDIPNNSSEFIAIGINQANELFKMANLNVHINTIDLLSDGIDISGEVEFPELFGYINGSISQLRITQSQGMELIGNISLQEIQCTGFKLKDIFFSFDGINDEFSGSGSIETSLFEAGANVTIISTGIDEIGLFLSVTNPKPLGATGLSLSGLNGNISNIQNPDPLIVTIGASLTPVGTPPEILEFSNVSLTYQFGTSLDGNGTFTILGTETANAGFEVREGLFKIYANVNFYDYINAAIEAGIAKNQDDSIDVFARFESALQIPDGDGFPLKWLGKFMSLPYTIAGFDNILFNTELSGKGLIDLGLFDTKFSYLLTYSGGDIHAEFAKNFSLFNEDVFLQSDAPNAPTITFHTPPKELSDWNSPTYNRFEGRSLIIDPDNYSNSKNKNGDFIQDFILTGDVETVVVRIMPDVGGVIMPSASITTPTGEIIDSDNVDDYINFIYTENTDNKGIYYTINNASAGTWIITIEDNSETPLVDVFGTLNEPGIIINDVQKNGNSVNISWADNNPDFDGQISLYYDYNNNGLDGALIVSGISEDDETDNYTFDVSSFGPGEYWVYAIMFDANGVPVTGYSPNSFTISSDIPAPENFSYALNNDNSINFSWEKINDGYTYDYLLFYEADGVVSTGSLNINTGDEDNYTFTNFDPSYSYQFMIVARRDDDALSEPSNLIEIDLALFQTITLNAGWNLIGLGIEPFDMSVAEVFSPLDNSLVQVNTQTLSYNPELPDFLNTLSTLENGRAYWVKVAQAEQFIVRGKYIELSNIQIPLSEGWNLFSFPSQTPQDIEDALGSISDYIIQVNTQTQSYNPTLPPFLNTLEELGPGKGYWIKVNQNCLLTF